MRPAGETQRAAGADGMMGFAIAQPILRGLYSFKRTHTYFTYS